MVFEVKKTETKVKPEKPKDEAKQVSKKSGLDLMREPFEPRHINKLPKGTKSQNECPEAEKVNCTECGGWHHPKIKHLDYVGHAAITNRLLECDPNWSWKFVATEPNGLPVLDADGGLWIELTVCGVTRLGYGDAGTKKGGEAMKERIGDALRNAAMRFGAALELWHKGDLHPEEVDEPITLDQSRMLVEHLILHDVLVDVFCAKAGIRSPSELPTSKLEDAFTWIEKRGIMQKEKAEKTTSAKPTKSLLDTEN
jgi:hypothetical protein